MASFNEVINTYDAAEKSLIDLRNTLMESNAKLIAGGSKLSDADVKFFNERRSRLAQDLAYFTTYVIDQVEAVPYFGKGRADEARAKIKKAIGTTDIASAMLDRIPPIKMRADGSLGMAPLVILAYTGLALAIGAALVAVLYGVTLAIDSFNGKAHKTANDNKAEELRQKAWQTQYAACVAAGGKAADCVTAANKNTPKPPGDDIPWGTISIVVGVVALVALAMKSKTFQMPSLPQIPSLPKLAGVRRRRF